MNLSTEEKLMYEVMKAIFLKSYLLTVLYNASSTINTYWTQRIQHDMYGCG